MPSVNSCQRRSIILGMVELILLACKRVVLRDRNTLHSSSLARSAAPELSELLLPLLWRGFFFFLLYGNKAARFLRVPLPINKRSFLALCFHLAQVPCSGHGARCPGLVPSSSHLFCSF